MADDIRVHTLGLSMNLSVRRVVVVRRHDLGLPLSDMHGHPASAINFDTALWATSNVLATLYLAESA